MIKEQIDVKIVAADFEVDVLPDEDEAGPEFQEELTDMGEQAALQLALAGIVGQR
jgi:hypothetical protein